MAKQSKRSITPSEKAQSRVTTLESSVAKERFDILLVDDDPELLLVIGELLRLRDFSVITARDALDATKHLEENHIRLIILDINLNGEDGVRWMTFMKKNHPDIPVILYTGLSHDETEVKTMLGKGASCYVNKAQLPAALLFAVREVLSSAPIHPAESEAA